MAEKPEWICRVKIEPNRVRIACRHTPTGREIDLVGPREVGQAFAEMIELSPRARVVYE